MSLPKKTRLRGGTLDIETFMGHYRAFVDKLYETRVTEVLPETLASYCFKPYGSKKTVTVAVWDFDTYEEFLWSLWHVFNDNHFLIGQNIKRFDTRQTFTFFAENGLPMPRKPMLYDTMLIAKKNCKLPSYSLKYMVVRFKIGEKLETGGDSLWKGAEEGDPVKRKHFLKYNTNDSVVTEKLFDYFVSIGWSEKPCAKYYIPGEGCVRCGIEDMQDRGKNVPRSEGMVEGYMCKNCGKRNYTFPHTTWRELSPDFAAKAEVQ